MELLETLAKLLGLLVFYTVFFLVGGTLVCFVIGVAGIYYVCNVFGEKKLEVSPSEMEEIQKENEMFVSTQTVLHKGEEAEVEVMYTVHDDLPEIFIYSITSNNKDYTDKLSHDEMARLVNIIEAEHVR